MLRADSNRRRKTRRISCPLRLCRELYYPEEYDPLTIASVQSIPGLGLPPNLGISPNHYTQRSDYLSLRELTMAYALPARLAQVVGASRASLNVSGRNLHTWTKWPGLNPESRSDANTSLAYPGTPPLSEFIVALHVTF